MQVVQAGTEAQVAEATKVLAETRRALYRILAGDDADEGEAAPPPRPGPAASAARPSAPRYDRAAMHDRRSPAARR